MHDAYGRAVRRVEYELEECWGDLWVPDPAILMQFRKEGENMEEKSEDQDSGAWSTEDESDED